MYVYMNTSRAKGAPALCKRRICGLCHSINAVDIFGPQRPRQRQRRRRATVEKLFYLYVGRNVVGCAANPHQPCNGDRGYMIYALRSSGSMALAFIIYISRFSGKIRFRNEGEIEHGTLTKDKDDTTH